MNTPLVSIAIETYNGEKYLKEQLDSICTQTYKNIEVIVTDDCSTGETVKVLNEYSKSHGLKYYVNENKITYTHKSLVRYRQHSEQEIGIGIQKKVSIFRIIYSNILNRWNEIDFKRVVAFREQLKNLQALKNNLNCFNQSEVPLKDVILYFEGYLNNKLYIRAFLVDMKYHKVRYPHKNYLFLKNILMDIIG